MSRLVTSRVMLRRPAMQARFATPPTGLASRPFSSLTKSNTTPSLIHSKKDSLTIAQRRKHEEAIYLDQQVLLELQSRRSNWLLAIAGAFLAGQFFIWQTEESNAASVDYDKVREAIKGILDDPNFDDGSLGPIFVRLGWHAAGTYSKHDNTGGSNGGLMRFPVEGGFGANKGLEIARGKLDVIKKQFPDITYADLYSLASVVAIEAMGGPVIPWRPGRSDFPDATRSAPDGSNHVRDVFYRMGFTDQEIVALLGAHAIGRCHPDRSGYLGPWTQSPTMFTNDFYVQLLERTWTEKKWDGPKQYEDETKTLMMTPADLALIRDPKFLEYVKLYAGDEEDFAAAFSKLQELGVPFDQKKPWYKFW